MPEEIYEFTDQTYDRLAAAGIPPLSATDVLHATRRVRRHIGATLQVAGQDRHGQWLAVALVELADDRYEVTGGRWLDDDEISVIGKMLGQGA